VNRPGGEALTGNTPDKNHMANWLECIRSRQMPNAPVDVGHRSAVAAHMANIAYRERRRVTLEEARAWPGAPGPGVWYLGLGFSPLLTDR
jgi:hypothetical protein